MTLYSFLMSEKFGSLDERNCLLQLRLEHAQRWKKYPNVEVTRNGNQLRGDTITCGYLVVLFHHQTSLIP